MQTFDKLIDYINHKPQCPFCNYQLVIGVETNIGNPDVEIDNVQPHDDSVEFQFTAPVEHYTYINTFKIKLFYNNKINYNIIQPNYWDKKAEKHYFVTAFNNANIQIFNTCNNSECKLEYFRSSLPIKISTTKLQQITLYNESFKYNGFLAQNDFTDNKFKIYVVNSSVQPIETKLFNLNKDSAPSVFNRIKVVTVFS